jgi:hypothetical protein
LVRQTAPALKARMTALSKERETLSSSTSGPAAGILFGRSDEIF